VRLVILAALVPILTACVSRGALRCGPGETRTVVESLYFGIHAPDGRVDPGEWNAFLAEVVTPRFPNGMTSWPAAGQWRGQSGVVEREASYVVHIAHADTPERDAAIRAIAEEYKRRFQQEAVMRVRHVSCVSF
jgi:hypothetical protein